jgi:hypothetical protein
MITNLQIRNFRGLKDVTLHDLRRVNLIVGGNDTGKTSILEAISLLLGDGTTQRNLPIAFRSSQRRPLPFPDNILGGVPITPQIQEISRTNARDEFENFWLWIFNDRDQNNRIALTAKTHDRNEVRLHSEQRGSATVFLRSIAGGGMEGQVAIKSGGVDIPETPAIPGYKVSRLSIRPSHPAEDAEGYNQVALNAGGEQQIEKVMREINPEVRRLRYAKLPGTSSPLIFVDVGLKAWRSGGDELRG